MGWLNPAQTDPRITLGLAFIKTAVLTTLAKVVRSNDGSIKITPSSCISCICIELQIHFFSIYSSPIHIKDIFNKFIKVLNWVWWYSRDPNIYKLWIYSTQVVFSFICDKFHVINIFMSLFFFWGLFSPIDFVFFLSTRSMRVKPKLGSWSIITTMNPWKSKMISYISTSFVMCYAFIVFYDNSNECDFFD